MDLEGTTGGFDEAWLQNLIHRVPATLPLAQIDPALGDAVPVCVELPLVFGASQSGSLDNLLFTSTGIPILVEVKLWRNPEARRKVVAQALDYAAALFKLSYVELESAIARARTARGDTFEGLWDLVIAEGARDPGEAEFIDNVSRNLRAGRGIVIVAGDGIREEVEALSELLQSHPALRFTFALAEIAVFDLGEDRLVIPSVPLKTELVERGVLRIMTSMQGGPTIAVEPALRSSEDKPERSSSISEDEFMEVLAAKNVQSAGALREFLTELGEMGVRPEMQRSMNLKYPSPQGRDYNLASITRGGIVDTGPASWADREDTGHVYDTVLAGLIGGRAQTEPEGPYGVRVRGNSMPRLHDLLPEHSKALRDAIKDYIAERLKKDGVD